MTHFNVTYFFQHLYYIWHLYSLNTLCILPILLHNIHYLIYQAFHSMAKESMRRVLHHRSSFIIKVHISLVLKDCIVLFQCDLDMDIEFCQHQEMLMLHVLLCFVCSVLQKTLWLYHIYHLLTSQASFPCHQISWTAAKIWSGLVSWWNAISISVVLKFVLPHKQHNP